MSAIDWSKAPEGYDFHFQGKAADPYGKFYKATSDRFVSEVDSYILYRDLAELFIVNHRTEQAAQWAGEGLPPVGVVCEINHPELGWTRCDIVAHKVMDCGGKTHAIAWIDGNTLDQSQGLRFRPIRTPEQIEADKRLHEIRNALTTIKAGQQLFPNDLVRGNITLSVVEAMIDAGYRVQVMP